MRSSVSTFADGVACRELQEEPLAIILAGAADVVAVSEDEISEAIRVLYEATHNIAEGAGAAALAGAIKLRERYMHKKIATVLTGGNVDRDIAARILAGHTPSAS
ncbi:MAG: pyridoxal-phosphate dependent enzyme [Allorhizobium sp.]